MKRLWKFIYRMPNGEVRETVWIEKLEGDNVRMNLNLINAKVIEVQNKYV